MEKVNVRCLYDHIITTTNKKKGSLVIDTKDVLLSRQTVLVAGPNANVVPGEEIEINMDRFPKVMRDPNKDKYTKNGIGPDNYDVVIPIEKIDGQECLFISSREIKWIYEDKKVEEFVSTTT